jgi:predicted choloylglycine hydrolase
MNAKVTFETLIEDEPGELWKKLFAHYWPAYRAWFLRSGTLDRPSYLQCRRALRDHMPELMPIWERLVELSGGGDVEARFLSLWCPPPFIAGCSQSVWLGSTAEDEPVLLRNYDFAPNLLEGSWLATRWRGRRVLAIGDCLWGALDGQNDAGLAASLSFGGRVGNGTGFGIPLVLRYVLQVARDTHDAIEVLRRVPVSMTYSVTLLDGSGQFATVFVAPDRDVEVSSRLAVTNYQHKVEWPEHARATAAVQRLECLEQRVEHAVSVRDGVAAMLMPPLFQTAYVRGHGTLYTAAYRPRSDQVELFWPGQSWLQTVSAPNMGRRTIEYPLEVGNRGSARGSPVVSVMAGTRS